MEVSNCGLCISISEIEFYSAGGTKISWSEVDEGITGGCRPNGFNEKNTLIDGKTSTNWGTGRFNGDRGPTILTFKSTTPVTVYSYRWFRGSDKDPSSCKGHVDKAAPKSWTIEASTDNGSTWKLLHTVCDYTDALCSEQATKYWIIPAGNGIAPTDTQYRFIPYT